MWLRVVPVGCLVAAGVPLPPVERPHRYTEAAAPAATRLMPAATAAGAGESETADAARPRRRRGDLRRAGRGVRTSIGGRMTGTGFLVAGPHVSLARRAHSIESKAS